MTATGASDTSIGHKIQEPAIREAPAPPEMERLFAGRSKLEEARTWLKVALADGQPHRADELHQAALATGIKKRTLQLAAQEVALIEPVYGKKGIQVWLWRRRATS